jgi:hypothetical protein
MLKSVVFPDPLGPLRAVAFRESMERVTPWMAVNSLGLPALKILWIFWSWIN